jgi:aldose sugar dehydrogenase
MICPAFLLNSIFLSFVTLICGLLLSIFITSPHLLDASSTGPQFSAGLSNVTGIPPLPRIYDIDLKVDVVYSGLNFPTSIAFLSPDDIMVLEKNTGQVRRILNGTLLPDPLLIVHVSNQSERGMLGIALDKKNSSKDVPTPATDVFLYFTESSAKDRDNQTLGNRLYKYQFIENKLVNPKKLLDLPSSPGPAHNGGRIIIGPDNNVYFTIGNLNVNERIHYLTRAENLENGTDPDGRAGILRITQDGQPVPNGSIIGDQYPLNLYYAYGIRNSFGMDFDPVTGNLWDTENGPRYGDEINLIEPGFNSGWNKVQGIWEEIGGRFGPILTKLQERELLVDFDGRGKYSNPEFTWIYNVGPTALKFLGSDILGKEYENDMFVGDFNNGNVYHFDLIENRTALALDGLLKDKIANNRDELKTTLFGQGFGAITDLEVGPDGYLYVLSLFQGGNDCATEIQGNPCVSYSSTSGGTIYRIVPETVVGAKTRVK